MGDQWTQAVHRAFGQHLLAAIPAALVVTLTATMVCSATDQLCRPDLGRTVGQPDQADPATLPSQGDGRLHSDGWPGGLEDHVGAVAGRHVGDGRAGGADVGRLERVDAERAGQAEPTAIGLQADQEEPLRPQ
ncbi:MAG: hypothetical protein U0R26_11825 [Solirubrobacterales bacterium]